MFHRRTPGMILAQRFPRLRWHVAGAPVLDFSGTMVQYAVIQQALGRGPIRFEAGSAGVRVYETCDDKDGLKTGCHRSPKLRVSAGKDLAKCAVRRGVMPRTQIDALTAIYSDVRIGNERVYPIPDQR
jgi:hypothetical protein